jgi:polysaccharide export outer membrane protein
MPITFGTWFMTLVLWMGLLGCTAVPIKEGVYGPDMGDGKGPPVTGLKPSQFFTAELKASGDAFSTDKKIDAESMKLGNEYRLGPGDRFAFLVRGREDISREEIIVAPDGEVSLPRVGIMNVQGRTLSELTETFVQLLGSYYENPEVTLVMKAYNNNRVFVLGRVTNPGAVSFQGPGTLLEALSLAGGLPVDTAKSFLTRCTIVRGKDLVMRVDLKELLEKGNMRLNARLQNGDVIFIPQSDDQLAYVMGEVKSPGVVPLRPDLSLLDAIMNAGGPTKAASLRDIFLIRRAQGNGVVERISFQNLVGKADYRRNYALSDGDMIYVPENGLSKLNYFSSQIAPFFTVVGIAANVVSGVGLLETFGNVLYGGGAISSSANTQSTSGGSGGN